ncbi:hypothetical protein J2S78_000786 [Salibacterium salarium]|nr:hypothetical protein [Salibacterium salarium]
MNNIIVQKARYSRAFFIGKEIMQWRYEHRFTGPVTGKIANVET